MQPAGGRNPLPVVALLLAVALVTFLMTGWSNPIWQHTPELIFLQFPFRLLTAVAPIFALALAVAMSELRANAHIGKLLAVAIAAVLTFSMYIPFHQVPEPGQTVAAHLQAFVRTEGAAPTDEYTPQTADNDALTIGKPPYWLAPEPTAPAPAPGIPGPAPMHFTVQTERAEFLVLNLRDYPAWRVRLNQHLDIERDQRDDGLIAFGVPAGNSRVDIRYARGWDDIVGDGVSLIAVVILLAIASSKGKATGLA